MISCYVSYRSQCMFFIVVIIDVAPMITTLCINAIH